MVRNRHLARAIHDAGWGEFVDVLDWQARKWPRVVGLDPPTRHRPARGAVRKPSTVGLADGSSAHRAGRSKTGAATPRGTSTQTGGTNPVRADGKTGLRGDPGSLRIPVLQVEELSTAVHRTLVRCPANSRTSVFGWRSSPRSWPIWPSSACASPSMPGNRAPGGRTAPHQSQEGGPEGGRYPPRGRPCRLTPAPANAECSAGRPELKPSSRRVVMTSAAGDVNRRSVPMESPASGTVRGSGMCSPAWARAIRVCTRMACENAVRPATPAVRPTAAGDANAAGDPTPPATHPTPAATPTRPRRRHHARPRPDPARRPRRSVTSGLRRSGLRGGRPPTTAGGRTPWRGSGGSRWR